MASSLLAKPSTRPVCARYEWNAPPRSWLWPSFSDLKVFRTILSSNFGEARRNFSHAKEPERRIPQTGLTTLTRSKKGKSGRAVGPNRSGQSRSAGLSAHTLIAIVYDAAVVGFEPTDESNKKRRDQIMSNNWLFAVLILLVLPVRLA